MCATLNNGEICPRCNRRYYSGVGRRLSLSDELIEAIIKYLSSPAGKPTVKAFRAASGVSDYTYRSIAYGHLKNTKDRARVDKIAAKYGHKINWQ